MFLLIGKSRPLPFLLLFFLLKSTVSFGQVKKSNFGDFILTPDTTAFSKPMPFISWDSRFSVIEGDWITIKGIKIGVKLGEKRHRLAFAYKWLTFEQGIGILDLEKPIFRPLNNEYFSTKDLYYYTVSFDYYLIQNKRFALATPLEIGWGAVYNEHISQLQNFKIYNAPKTFVPFLIGVYGEYKATRYVGLNSRLGYRYVVNVPTEYPSICGLYLDLGLKLYVGTAYRDTKWLYNKFIKNN